LFPNYQDLCLKCTQWLRREATADSAINDQLIKMHSAYSWIRRVFSSSVSYFVASYFWRKIFNITKLLHQYVTWHSLSNW